MEHSIIVFIVVVAIMIFLIARKAISVGRNLSDKEDYLYGRHENKGLDVETTWMTSVASNFQSASVLAIGLTLGYLYGLTMLITAITYSLGIAWIYYETKRLPDEKQRGVFDSGELPYDRIFKGTDIRWKIIVNVLIYVALIITAVLEIWLGSDMINHIVVALPNTEANIQMDESGIPVPVAVTSIILTVLLFIYVYAGGYAVVAKTDKLQLGYIFLLLIILIFSPVAAAFTQRDITFDWPALFIGGASADLSWGFMALLLGIVFLNVPWQYVDPQQWQRAHAADNHMVYIDSLPTTVKMVFITWGIPVSIGAIYAALGNEGVGKDVVSVLEGWKNIDILLGGGGIITGIIFGLSACGIIAAALSTADTVIVATLARLILLNGNELELDIIRKRAVAATFLVWFFAGILYLIDKRVQDVIFAVYSAQVLFAPFFLYFIRNGGSSHIETRKTILIVFAYIVSFFIALLLNFSSIFPSGTGYVWPVVVLAMGWFLAHRTMSDNN